MQTVPPATGLLPPLALLVGLALLHGPWRRRLPGTALAPQLMGAAFGAVASLSLGSPEAAPIPVAGFEVVPIALAGAFLGLRGVAIAVAISTLAAAATNAGDPVAAAAPLWMAGAIGLGWSIATVGPSRRSPRALLALGLAAAAAFLPGGAVWAADGLASGVLAASCLIVLPAIASLLERDRVTMLREEAERTRRADEASGALDTAVTLTLALSRAEAAGRIRDGSAILALRVRSQGVALALWGEAVEAAVLHALARRLRAVLPPGAVLRMVTGGAVVVVLAPGQEPATAIASLSEAARRAPFAVPGMAPVRLCFARQVATFDRVPKWSEIADALDGCTTPTKPLAAQGGARVEGAVGTLFATADRLLDARQDGRRLGRGG